MNHDVYICYGEDDKKLADALSRVLEENGIKSWTKSKDMSSDDTVDRITNAIADSKCFIFLLSKNSKDLNFALTETDIAFSREIPILVANVDNSRVGGNYQFIFENQMIINPDPSSKKLLKTIVEETSKILKKPFDNIKINSEFIKPFENVNPYAKENTIKKYIKIAIPIVVVLILIYFFVILPTGQNSTADGEFFMNVTDVDVSDSNGEYKYTVHGESYNMPDDSERYFMNIQFLDKEKNLVYEVNSTADEFKYGIICSCNLDEDNITDVNFKLSDINGNVLSKEKYVLK